MSLQSYITKVRAKTDQEKKTLIFVWTFVITFFVAIIWLMNMSYIITNEKEENAKLMAEAEKKAEQISKASTTVVNNQSSWSLGEFVSTNADAVKEGWSVLTGKSK